MTQCERVLQYMRDFGSINSAQAFVDLGCYRLGARIYDLRHKRGYSIKKTTVSAKTDMARASASPSTDWRIDMLNKIFLMGRLVADPELRRTQNGTAVTSFTLAVDRDFKSPSGEKETDFIDVVAWRNTAEFVCNYFTKGRMALAEGRIQIREWKDKEGNNRRIAEVVADHVYFADSKKDSPEYKPAGEQYGSFRETEDDGNLPF